MMVVPVTVSEAAFLMVMPRARHQTNTEIRFLDDEQVAMRIEGNAARVRKFRSRSIASVAAKSLRSITRNGGHDAGSSIYLPDAIVKGIADGEIALAIKCDVIDVREQSIARFSAITRKGKRRRSRHK